MTYRVTVEEDKVQYKSGEEPEKYWEITEFFTTANVKTAAGMMRAIADKLDPPRREWERG